MPSILLYIHKNWFNTKHKEILSLWPNSHYIKYMKILFKSENRERNGGPEKWLSMKTFVKCTQIVV